MTRPLEPAQRSFASNGFVHIRQSHPLLSGFPLAVMMLGTLLVVFAVTMTLRADADGGARTSRSIPHVARSVAARPVSLSIF
jgi:hypothetical protein